MRLFSEIDCFLTETEDLTTIVVNGAVGRIEEEITTTKSPAQQYYKKWIILLLRQPVN